MTKEVEGYESYLKAGRIASKVRKEVPQIIFPGKAVIDVCEEVEEKIRMYGGKPAFPCNVGINELAAHYTSDPGDRTVISKGSLVKIDLGVEVNGYIADTALSLAFDPSCELMITAVEEALGKVLENVKDNCSATELGGQIERIISGYGFKPIVNLCGHKMERYILHSGKSIPNVSKGGDWKLKEGEVYAIEPFLTTINGAGRVVEGRFSYIFRFLKDKGVKDLPARKFLTYIKRNFRAFPFTKRWLEEWLLRNEWSTLFEEFVKKRCLHAYPVLVEGKGEPVSQAEHTVIVRSGGCEVITE